MTAPAISIESISKRFRLYHERPSSLKERLLRMRRSRADDFWALREVSHEIPAGSTVALVGANGSGKTTLLKIIGGILRPSSGRVVTRGRIAALLELGAGFHPELTGRENVYLNASILGLSKRETDHYFDDIIAFAELEEFVDNQVKFYSSGMFVRLGFAVAVHVNPQILLVDEVLSVGDEAFQRKCIERVKQFQREGRTIVVVTHGLDRVREICDSAVLLERGRVEAAGEVDDVVREFRLRMLARQGALAHPEVTGDIEITGVQLFDATGNPAERLAPGDPMLVQIDTRTNRAVDDAIVSVAVLDAGEQLVHETDTSVAGVRVKGREGDKQRLRFELRTLPLNAGRYFVTVGVRPRDRSVLHDFHDRRYWFEVGKGSETRGRLFIPTDVRVENL